MTRRQRLWSALLVALLSLSIVGARSEGSARKRKAKPAPAAGIEAASAPAAAPGGAAAAADEGEARRAGPSPPGLPEAGVGAVADGIVLTLPHVAPKSLRCADCHSEEGFFQPYVRFAHERTGFPLAGAHQTAPCRGCHASGDWERPVPATCAGCHRDVHAGELGLRCEGCHEERDWRTTFTVDAHRRTAFPLSGRHALIPCVECHPNARDRSFGGAVTACAGCHARDAARAALTTVDHLASGFSPNCRSCHQVWSFAPAAYPAHDACFEISRGVHAKIRCEECHRDLAGTVATGTCRTGTATCTGCHVHACGKTDPLHANVPGYACSDQRCVSCHRFAEPR